MMKGKGKTWFQQTNKKQNARISKLQAKSQKDAKELRKAFVELIKASIPFAILAAIIFGIYKLIMWVT